MYYWSSRSHMVKFMQIIMYGNDFTPSLILKYIWVRSESITTKLYNCWNSQTFTNSGLQENFIYCDSHMTCTERTLRYETYLAISIFPAAETTTHSHKIHFESSNQRWLAWWIRLRNRERQINCGIISLNWIQTLAKSQHRGNPICQARLPRRPGCTVTSLLGRLGLWDRSGFKINRQILRQINFGVSAVGSPLYHSNVLLLFYSILTNFGGCLGCKMNPANSRFLLNWVSSALTSSFVLRMWGMCACMW